MNKKKLYILFCTQYIIMFFSFGAMAPFISSYLRGELGATTSQIGLISSIVSIVTIFSVIIIGLIADYSQKYKMTLNAVLLLASISLMFLTTTNVYVVGVIFYGMYKFFSGTLTSLNDGIASSNCVKEDMNYGIIRTFGTLGYVLGSVITGVLMNAFDNPQIFIILAVLSMIISTIIVMLYPKADAVNEPISIKNIKTLLKNKNYICIILVSAFVFGSTTTGLFFDPLLLEEFGKGDLKGYIAVFQTFPEIIIMPFTILIVKKIGFKKALYISSISTAIRWGLISYTDSYVVYFLATLLHGVAVSFILPVVSFYIGKNIKSGVRSTAFALHIAAISIVVSITGLIVGQLNQMFNNFSVVYITLMCSAIIGFIISMLIQESDIKSNFKNNIV